MSQEKRLYLSHLATFKDLQDSANDAKFVAQVSGKGLSTNDYTDEDETKLNGVEAGAQVNVIESITVDGVAQTITEKGVALNLDAYAKKADITSAYKAGGSKTPAELTSDLLVTANEGKVYNVSGTFSTTADFVEGVGSTYPAGTNVVVIEATPAEGATPATYKFDVLAGFVDLSTYVVQESGKGLSTNDFTAGYKTQLDTLAQEDVATESDIRAMFPTV